MLNKIIIASTLALAAQSAFADQHVNGYTRSNGTYVSGYERSSPNGTARDNYSYSGNTNPYTGSTGTSTQLDKGDYGYTPRQSKSRSGNSSSSYGYGSSSNDQD